MKETILKETILKETISQETILKETISQETILKETISQETILKETISQETITIIADEFPKPFSITKWLVLSSCFFLIPATYALKNNIYIYGGLSVSTSICSINHWRCAEYGIRRNVDRFFAIVAFFIYVPTGLFIFPIYLSAITLSTIIVSFVISNYLSKNHYPYFVFVHMIFHASVAITKILVIYYLLNITNYKEFINV